MTARAALDSHTVPGPDFESGSRMHPPFIQSHCSPMTSPARHPVSNSNRMTATACGHQNSSRVLESFTDIFRTSFLTNHKRIG